MRRLLAIVALLTATALLHAADDYKLGPDSQEQPDVPKGKVTKYTWKSDIFPGTVRDYWVYVPAQYDRETPAAVMVFQDGNTYAKADGQFRVPIVFDNLIHKKEMPATVGIFINPGVLPEKTRQGRPPKQQPQLRVRHALGPVRPLPRKGNPARSRQVGEPAPGRRRPGDLRPSAPAASAPSPPPGSGRTCSARS